MAIRQLRIPKGSFSRKDQVPRLVLNSSWLFMCLKVSMLYAIYHMLLEIVTYRVNVNLIKGYYEKRQVTKLDSKACDETMEHETTKSALNSRMNFTE